MTADLLPEQRRALAYVRKRGTDAPLHDIRSRVAGTYADFEALVAALSSDAAREHRIPGWCIQEVIDHLVESDLLAVRQLADLLDGRDVLEAIPAGLQSPSPLSLDWVTLRQRFRSVHEEFLDVLDLAKDETPLTAAAAVQMVVKRATPEGTLLPISWVEHFDWKAFAILAHAHNREHIAQVQRIMGPSQSVQRGVG